jgi:hypothetical protein
MSGQVLLPLDDNLSLRTVALRSSRAVEVKPTNHLSRIGGASHERNLSEIERMSGKSPHQSPPSAR